ncbi:MAG: hypothetical protein A2Y75_03740 [Candidatus Solincola sediminis]|uniref:Oxidoreductase molybdopterin-binding domain-containing protein n=1 Tax=Candidatus Solincola sediminis TaxID=1797199 RepID=A0A1F2WHJ3_9ACTN|nr:MAG: hypothetical protein A2Y75_03740 [Candidatus Solincola sediminis]
MTRRRSIFRVLAAFFFVLAAASWIAWGLSTESKRVLKYDDILSLPPLQETYHSINNWQTEEDTDFKGVPLYELIEEYGVRDPAAQIKVIAPDGYFWPAVGTTLELGELRKQNRAGLYTMLAYELNSEVLQPEPDGSGPLRFVMPQYEETEVNKPSWVSNVRLIEVGPLAEGFPIPQAGEVPLDEVWMYGNVAPYHTFPIWPAAAATVLATLILLGTLIGRSPRKAASVLAALLITTMSMAVFATSYAHADAGKVFNLDDLKNMPVFSGHYTFLKSQEPFTYYEKDYTGVPLSYLIERAMTLGSDATGVIVRARDGYKVNLSLQQARKTYPGGLKAIVAYAGGGKALDAEEGPLRLIVPQETPGNKDQGGDANTPASERMVCAIEVAPLPQGMSPPGAETIPNGSLAVYGAVSAAIQTEPEPAPSGGGETKPKRATPEPAPSIPSGESPVMTAAGRIELLKDPLWGRVMILAIVLGRPTWSYSMAYLDLPLRTGQ